MKFVHCGRNEYIKNNKTKNIILWGASKQLYEAVQEFSTLEFNLEDRVIAVIDADEKKHGSVCKVAHKEFIIQGVDYLLHNKLENCSILITSRFYLDIIKQLREIKLEISIEVYAYPCIILDYEESYEDKYASRITNQAISEYEEYLTSRRDLNSKEKNNLRKRLKGYLDGEDGIRPNIIPSIVLMHSNICSLKCSNCCDLIPKVKKPYYLSAEEVLKDLNNVLKGVDKCIRVDLTDGEVFLYRELDTLLENIINHPKVETVFMFTNATIMPKESTLKLLQNKKCFLNISDYGLEDTMRKFIDVLEEYSINHNVLQDMEWMDFKLDSIKKRDEEFELLRYDFLRCGNKKCSKALFKGKLYACMPAFRYASLGIYENDNDYVTISENDSSQEVWEKLKGICMIDFIKTCERCNFGNTGLDIISAGDRR